MDAELLEELEELREAAEMLPYPMLKKEVFYSFVGLLIVDAGPISAHDLASATHYAITIKQCAEFVPPENAAACKRLAKKLPAAKFGTIRHRELVGWMDCSKMIEPRKPEENYLSRVLVATPKIKEALEFAMYRRDDFDRATAVELAPLAIIALREMKAYKEKVLGKP